MSKENKGNYLNKSGRKKTSGAKEQLIYGNGPTLTEIQKSKKKYKKNRLNG